jgi:hypothetical protein
LQRKVLEADCQLSKQEPEMGYVEWSVACVVGDGKSNPNWNNAKSKPSTTLFEHNKANLIIKLC